MSTTAAGTTFRLRTPSHIKSCHFTGSWDNYTKRYQMNADKHAGAGWWTLTIKFGSSMPPARYWYYYILDGYFESHDPNKPTCHEPTRKLTLNIFDHGIPTSPVSSISSGSSRSSSRFPSPNSSAGSSPTSSTSSRRSAKRSGGVYDLPSPYDSEQPYYHTKPHPAIPTGTRRTPSPRRQQAALSHIVHPKPRNPMAAHKLTLDTESAYYAGRPVSMITTAATTASDSPLSARSYSSCSGGSYDSRSSSPTTPICQCDEYEVNARGHYCEGYDSEEEYRYRRAPYPADRELAYQMERGLRL